MAAHRFSTLARVAVIAPMRRLAAAVLSDWEVLYWLKLTGVLTSRVSANSWIVAHWAAPVGSVIPFLPKNLVASAVSTVKPSPKRLSRR